MTDDLTRLHWRDFEILLARIFQAQGFEIELGPGSGDEGVDIRLLQRDPIGDVLTLVQAKRFGPRNKIDLQAVAALYGVGMAQRADKIPVRHDFELCPCGAPLRCASVRPSDTRHLEGRGRLVYVRPDGSFVSTSPSWSRQTVFGRYWQRPLRHAIPVSCTLKRVLCTMSSR